MSAGIPAFSKVLTRPALAQDAGPPGEQVRAVGGRAEEGIYPAKGLPGGGTIRNPAVLYDLSQRPGSTRSGASNEAVRSGVLDRGRYRAFPGFECRRSQRVATTGPRGLGSKATCDRAVVVRLQSWSPVVPLKTHESTCVPTSPRMRTSSLRSSVAAFGS